MSKPTKVATTKSARPLRKTPTSAQSDVTPIQTIVSGTGVSVSETEHDVTIRCDKRLTITCGKATLVLEPDGSITIRGTSLESSVTGDHRLRGATISLN